MTSIDTRDSNIRRDSSIVCRGVLLYREPEDISTISQPPGGTVKGYLQEQLCLPLLSPDTVCGGEPLPRHIYHGDHGGGIVLWLGVIYL